MMKRFNRWLLIWVVVLAVPFWWLLVADSRGGGPAKPVHIADLRKLAAIIPGARPVAVTATLLTKRLAISDYYAAGLGLKRRPIGIVTWTLPVPNRAPIVIDPGMPVAEANLGEFIDIDHSKLSQIAAETGLATLILHTQGHASDPVSGTARAPYLLGGKAGMVSLGLQQAVMASSQPRSFTTAQAVAPGVVVIPTTSYAPNTSLIFVALGDGREFLFTGNITTLTENWTQLRIRSHLAALFGPRQNSDETFAWLRTIRALHSEAPQLVVVPGHDDRWLIKQLANSTITEMQPAILPRHRHQ